MPSLCLVVFVILVSGICLSQQSSYDWSYAEENGPNEWPGVCQTGKRQSPINIETDNTLKDDLGSLKFTRYDFAYTAILTNTGHNVKITLKGVPVYLTGGGLTSTFVLEQMHFHWGAEHTIDGVRDVLELHFVHYDKQYGNFTIASQKKNGLAVVAVLFKLADEDNEDLNAIEKAVEAVSRWVGRSGVEIQGKVVPLWLLPKDKTTFYRYDGSLTTPDCHETVTWFIFSERLTISESQLSVFKNIQNHYGTLDLNYRPIQEVGNRKVYHHLLGYHSASSRISPNNLYTAVLIIVFARLRIFT